jgi:hypothetical protein
LPGAASENALSFSKEELIHSLHLAHWSLRVTQTTPGPSHDMRLKRALAGKKFSSRMLDGAFVGAPQQMTPGEY